MPDNLSLIARYAIAGTILETGSFSVKDAVELQDWLTAYKTYEEFRSRLWAAAVRLYNGGRDASFIATFARSIDVELTKAWNKGADDMGVQPDEMSKDDMGILAAIVNNENKFIERLAGDIQDDKDNGMERDQFNSKYGSRIDLWSNRFTEVVNRARMHFGSKQRLVWRLGRTEEHCPECNSLSGLVAWGKEWEQSKLIPQNPINRLLTCQGWRCSCFLEPTTARRSSRALDRLTEIALRKAGL